MNNAVFYWHDAVFIQKDPPPIMEIAMLNPEIDSNFLDD